MKRTIASLQASPTAILTRLFSRFMRSSFPFPSPSDACHAGYEKNGWTRERQTMSDVTDNLIHAVLRPTALNICTFAVPFF